VNMMKIILVACFVILAVIVVIPLIAELQFDVGQLKEAVKTDPFNSQYFAGSGESILNEKYHHGDEMAYLDKAMRLYGRALELNPECADYSLKLGQIKLALFLKDKVRVEYIKSAFDNFKRAVKNDPNGFNISYSVGYAGISIWKFLGKEDKEFILSRLKYSLKLKPAYSKYVYPKLWNEAMDLNLLHKIEPLGRGPDEYITRLEKLELMRSTAKRTLNVARVVIESDWQGRADDKKNTYLNGNMYWSGTMDAAIIIPSGKSMIRIQAKGSPADNIHPYMKVELDGRQIGAAAISSSEWKQYDFKVKTDGGIKVLSIIFVNDGANPSKGEDRNLYIGRAEAI